MGANNSVDTDSFPKYTRCAIYTRQSRASACDFSSCESQFEACFQYIRSQLGQGWIYCNQRYDDEGYSSEDLERPGLQRLLSDIEAGKIDRVVVYRLDRLSRKVVHSASLLSKLSERGIALTMVTSPELGETANDTLMFNLFSSFAEYEQELIRDRLREARAALKRKGRRVAGVVPFGYTTDLVTKQLVPLRAEARRVQAIFQRAAKGETSRQIADHANRYGWRTKRTKSFKTGESRGGNRWTPRQILATLTNPVYIGLIRCDGETRPGAHAPLVTRELFDQAAAQIASRRTHKRPRSQRGGILWPLRGRIVCGKCGRLMSPSISGYRNFEYRYYRCRSRAGGKPPCPKVSAPAEEVERFVCELLGELPPEKEGLAGEELKARISFSHAWSALPDRTQRALLPQVVEQVVLDLSSKTIKATISPGALDADISLNDLL